jgi:hypothetical protein
MRRAFVFVLIAVVVVVTVGGSVWFQRDRTGMFQTLCEAGLPNLSRPSVVEADDLGCEILGPKIRATGILQTGFEASNFMTDDLGPVPKGGGFTGSTWYSCNQRSGCDRRLDSQLDKEIPGLCGTRLASVTVEGWTTITPGRYGHLGVYSREFFADRVIEVRPPSADFVAKRAQGYKEAGLDCENWPIRTPQ